LYAKISPAIIRCITSRSQITGSLLWLVRHQNATRKLCGKEMFPIALAASSVSLWNGILSPAVFFFHFDRRKVLLSWAARRPAFSERAAEQYFSQNV